jgi:5-methylcytosine-specific restriction endonuclease McrA
VEAARLSESWWGSSNLPGGTSFSNRRTAGGKEAVMTTETQTQTQTQTQLQMLARSDGRTLVLTHAYEPIKIVSWRRALTLLTLGKVEVLEEYDWAVRTVTVVMKVPAVVRLLRAFRRRRQPVKFSRVNIYARDGYRCQYCGEKKPIAELTYDHVVPRRTGGRTEWTNIVTACQDCNLRKGSRTPAQAGMTLRTRPVRPEWVPAVTITVSLHSVPDAWRDYLYWTGELRE